MKKNISTDRFTNRAHLFLIIFSTLFILFSSKLNGQIATKQLYFSDPAQALDRVDPVASTDATTSQTSTIGSSGFDVISVVGAAASSTSTQTASSHTFSYNSGTAGNRRLLLVGISYMNTDNEAVSSVTYGGIAMTLVGDQNYTGGIGGSTRYTRVYIYSLLAPATGSNSLVVNWNSALNFGAVVGAITYDGVNQSTPTGTFAGATGNNTTPSVTVTGATERLMFGVVSGQTTTNFAVTNSGTQLWSARPFATTAGSGQSKAGAASVTLTWSSSSSRWAAGGVSIIPATLTNNTTFTQGTPLCSNLTIKAGTINVANYISIVSGTMPANPTISAVLKYGSTTIATLNSPTYSSGTGVLSWSTTLGSDVTVPAGQSLSLVVTTTQAGVSYKIDYDSQTKPSYVDFKVSTFINITNYDVYDAAYPGGSIITSAFSGTTVFPRAVVSDPFGFSDITGLNISINPPGTNVAATSVATAGCTRTYEYAWLTGASGIYSLPATAKEGLENTVTDVQALSFDVCTPSITSPIFSLGASSTRCQGANTVTYTASSTNSTGMSYSLDAASVSAGNSINPTSGAVSFALNWNGTSTVTATAIGCGGPKTSIHTVTTTPTVGTPVFTAGPGSTVCQASGTITYGATASNSTGITYSLDAASVTGGNTINSGTGAVTYNASWNGTTNIIASAAGCNGPKTATFTVTVTPTVGTPVFALGATSGRCGISSATYTASSSNSTAITYSLDATSLGAGCTINTTTGLVTFSSSYTGTSVITASATGCNGPKTSTHTVSISTICPPVAVLDTVKGAAGAPLPIDVLANDYDPNNNMNTASLSVLTQPMNGSAVKSGSKIIYIPNGSFTGVDHFTYEICDNTSPTPLCSSGTVDITIDPSIYDPCTEATKMHVYYIPYPEQDARTALIASASAPITYNDIRTIISIQLPYPGMTLVWDHWEDGYESNALNPTQSTTLVWGDGNPYNGIAPGYANDIFPAGSSITLDNTMPANPRNPVNFFFDGKDCVASSGQITMTQVCGEPSIISVQCMKTNISSLGEFGTSFTIPAGEDFPSQDFRYTGLFIRGSENGTSLMIDKDNNGTFETTTTLNQGDSYLVNGGVKSGATVTADKPVGVDLHWGGVDGYSSREVPIFPATWYSNVYYSPVPTTGPASGERDTAAVMLYNSLNRDITINWSRGATSPTSGTITLPAKTVKRFPFPISATEAYKFENLAGESFVAIQICDSYTPGGGGNVGTTRDWSFNLISESRLTSMATIAWAPGSQDGTRNDNPIWVTPSANTTIYVKYDGNLLSGPNTSPCGLKFDASFPLNALNHRRLKNPSASNDNSGLAVYTCDGAILAAVYGEDPSTALGGFPSWDVGSTLQPFCATKLIFANDDYAYTLPNSPVTISILNNDNGFTAILDPSTVTTTGYLQPAHGTVTVNPNGTVIYTPDNGYVGIDTFEYHVCSTPSPVVCDEAYVYVKINSCPVPANQNLIAGTVFQDKNKDGVKNDDGTGFTPSKVYLYADVNCNSTAETNELVDSVSVDGSGTYQFMTYPGRTVADDFEGAGGSNSCASGSDGSTGWLTNWVDAGEGGSTGYCVSPAQSDANTDAEIVNDGSFSYALRLDDNNVSATRQINLSGASYAFLSFSYRRAAATLTAGENIIVQASTNGTTFTTIYTIAGDGTTDAGYVTVYNQDITAFAAATTYIRFLTDANVDELDYVFFDDISVKFTKYPMCYITKLDAATIPANYYRSTTAAQHAITASIGGTCFAPYDFGIAKNSVSVSGVLYNDANGLTDATINGTPLGNPAGATIYAYLVDGTGKVSFKTIVDPMTGAYSFPSADVATNYTLRLSTTNAALYATAPTAANLPSGWVSVGDSYGINNGAGSGNEAGTANSAIAVNTASSNISNVNFGIQLVNAGPDRLTCQYSSVSMGALSSPGLWTAQVGNPGMATINDVTSPTTSITNFTTPGTYSFLWTNNGFSDIAQVVVTAKPDAGADQLFCQAGIATLSGTSPNTGVWSAQAGNPSGAGLSGTVAGTATVDLNAASNGVFRFIYTASGCSDTLSVNYPSSLSVSGFKTDIDCKGLSTGEIAITASGGSGPYTYDWADIAGSSNSKDRSLLGVGTYTIIVTDSNGCSKMLSFIITEPNVPDCAPLVIEKY